MSNWNFKQEIIDVLSTDSAAMIYTESENDAVIDRADSYIGGEGVDGWISEMLGNIAYDNIERVVDETIEWLNNNNEIIVEVEYN